MRISDWSSDVCSSDLNGSNPLEVASEVERYCGWPGQAGGYKVGHSEIVRQRGRAQAALGPRYDLRAFDNVVDEGGNVPLDVLAKDVHEYIAGGNAGPTPSWRTEPTHPHIVIAFGRGRVRQED